MSAKYIFTLSRRVAALLQTLPESSLPLLIQINACVRELCQLRWRCARTFSRAARKPANEFRLVRPLGSFKQCFNIC
jgi:hypothetical protein